VVDVVEPGVDVVVGFAIVDVVIAPVVDVVGASVVDVDVDVDVVGGVSQPDTQNTWCFTSAPCEPSALMVSLTCQPCWGAVRTAAATHSGRTSPRYPTPPRTRRHCCRLRRARRWVHLEADVGKQLALVVAVEVDLEVAPDMGRDNLSIAPPPVPR
jgi:hypothetical protein